MVIFGDRQVSGEGGKCRPPTSRQAFIDVDTRSSVRPCRRRRWRPGRAGEDGLARATDPAADTEGRSAAARPTNPLNDVSIRAPAHCYTDARRNRQFVFNIGDAGRPCMAGWVGVWSLERRSAVPPRQYTAVQSQSTPTYARPSVNDATTQDFPVIEYKTSICVASAYCR